MPVQTPSNDSCSLEWTKGQCVGKKVENENLMDLRCVLPFAFGFASGLRIGLQTGFVTGLPSL